MQDFLLEHIMYLKSLGLQNFLSYGNNKTVYTFDRHQMTLVTAKNGNGKCVEKSTKINVDFMADETKSKFMEFFHADYNESMEVSIGQITDFYKLHPECMGKVSVETRHGYFSILAAEITAYDSNVYQIITKSGKQLKCSPQHRLLDQSNKWVYTETLNQFDIIQTEDGPEEISSITLLDYKEDLYDIEVDTVHEYYSNGIVSHNSSIIDGLVFCLFGKSFREIKKDLLVNSTNKKDCLSEVNLIGNNGKQVLVRRGIKPTIFEIYEDGILVDQNAASADYQKYLETHIIGMNLNTFIQTVIISKTRYTPFMKMKASERRSFVESILNIEVFGDMLKLQSKALLELKKEESNIATQIKLSDNTLSNKVDALKKIKALIAQVQQESMDSVKDSILALQDKVLRLEHECISLEEKRDTSDYSANSAKYETLLSKRTEIANKITAYERDLNKLKNTKDECHVCGGVIDISHIELHIKEVNDNIEKHKLLLIRINDTLPKLKADYDKSCAQKEFNRNIDFEISSNKRTIALHEHDINTLKNKKFDTSHYDIEVDALKSEIIACKNSRDESHINYQTIIENIDKNTFALSALKDTGIKSAIIQLRINSINKIINENLHRFGFYINFELDSEFNETIHFRGQSHLTYNSFSEGEKLRVDLALILAWRELSLRQSGMSCNLLFFDEITDASMDTEGVELFAAALNDLKDTHIWIISHTPEKLENYVRGYISLDKIDGFTVPLQNK